jgi:hypothetical protein
MFTAVFPMKHRTVLHSNRQRWTKLKLYLLRRVVFKSSFIEELMLNPLKLKSMKRQIVAAEVTIWEQD